MTISSIPPNTASAITPFNPLGKHTVGEEDKDTKNSSLKAVEESSQSVRTGIRQQGKAEVVEAIREDERQQQEQSSQSQRDGTQRNQAEVKEAREVRDHERSHSPQDHVLQDIALNPPNSSHLKDDRSDSHDVSQQQIRQTNRPIVDFSRNYLALVRESTRLGGIVSEAV